MITFQQFLEKYNGKFTDFDGYYGFQCMDLMHSYITEVLGLSDGRILSAPSARDVFVKFPNVFGSDYFNKEVNTPAGVPKEGDIVFWVNEPYGHVAIFIEGDANSFRSFDQNYPTGSPNHVQNHTYANVGGWLYPKQVTLPVNVEEQLKQCQTLLRGNEEANVSKDKDIAGLHTQIDDLTKKNEGLTRANDVLIKFGEQVRITLGLPTEFGADKVLQELVNAQKDYDTRKQLEKDFIELKEALEKRLGSTYPYPDQFDALLKALVAFQPQINEKRLGEYGILEHILARLEYLYGRKSGGSS